MRRADVRFRPEAREDLARSFYAVLEMSQSPRTAEGYLRRLQDRCDRIGDVPLGGRPRDDLVKGIRTVPFEKSAVIAYRVVGSVVEITNIFYAGEDYEAVLRGERERGEG